MSVSWVEIIPLVVSVISAIVVVASLLHKTKVDRIRIPAEAADSVASAAGALSEAYEKRLDDLVEQVDALTARVQSLEEIEKHLRIAVRVLGEQIENNGLNPCVDWRSLIDEVSPSFLGGE